jgi:hypothetical protein
MKYMELDIRQTDPQPFPDLGVCYDYDYSSRKVRFEVSEPELFADCRKNAGNLFVFHEGEQDLRELIGGAIDDSKARIRRNLLKALRDLNNIEPFSTDGDGSKGHPFESLVVLHYVEQGVSAKQPTDFRLAPLRKMWGTNYACQYEWADGQTLDRWHNDEVSQAEFAVHRKLQNSFLTLFPGREPCWTERKTWMTYSDWDKPELYQMYLAEILMRLHADPTSAAPFSADDRDDVERCLIRSRTQKACNALLDAIPSDPSGYEPSCLCMGYHDCDAAPRNIVLRNEHELMKASGDIPAFTIIDQYTLGREEDEDKRDHYGEDGPAMRYGS